MEMWRSNGHNRDLAASIAGVGLSAGGDGPRPISVADDEAVSALSPGRHDASSDDNEAGPIDGVDGLRKRKKKTYQKTSCETCKTRKVKCDRLEPACSWCARHNRPCIYLERQKPGSRAGSNPELEAKVNRLDALLQALGRRVEDHIAQDHLSIAQALSPAPTNQTLPSSLHHERSDALSAVLGQGQRQRTPTSSVAGLSFYSEDPTQRPPTFSQRSDSFRLPHSSNTPIPFGGNPSCLLPPDLPPHDIVYTLVDLYFKHCNTWCPILDRKSTFGLVFGSTSLGQSDRILLHAIVATTLRFFKDARLTPEMRAHYHTTSRQAVQMYAMENVTIPALRALVIICWDEIGTSNSPRGWNLLSLLVQGVYQLHLYQESSVYLSVEAEGAQPEKLPTRVHHKKPDSWIEDEGERRLCWMVYLLDRYCTVAATNCDFMLADEKMSRVLPCSYDLFSRNVPVETRALSPLNGPLNNFGVYPSNRQENLGSFSYHCEILTILSRVHTFLSNPIDILSANDTADWRNTYRSLDQALDSWLKFLPSEYSGISALCHSDPASRVANWFMLHSAYVTSVVRLHSVAAYPTSKSQYFVPSEYAMQRCLTAIQSLADISRDVIDANGLDLLGPPFALSLWVSARLLIVHAATVGGPIDQKIDFFIDTLRDIGQHWDVAENYAKILTRVVQRGQTGQTSFTSMRRNAFNLVTLTSATRRSGLEQTSTQNTSLAELDNIDVFEFFNYPRLIKPPSFTFQENHSIVFL